MPDTLVIVPCGGQKIWDRHPAQGPTPAKDAYISAPFVVNRSYAEAVGDAWVILSAKYGFISPDFLIPESYNVTFKRRTDDTATSERLHKQVRVLELDQYGHVIGLGGKEYRAMIEAAFAGTGCTLDFPFSGLPIGKAMATAKAAMADAQRRCGEEPMT